MQFRIFVKKIFREQLDFSILLKSYRIDSLALYKLNLIKVLQLYRQIEAKYTFESKKGKTWFENELRIFIWVVFNYSNYLNKIPSQLTQIEWQTISQYFYKDHLTCKYFFYCVQKNRRSQWTQDQDHFVMDHIKKPNFTNQWTQIGKQLFITSNGANFKKPKEIRQRWNNYLNPNVSKDKWSIDEDIALFSLVLKEGRKWAFISKILKSRSQHSVKNRYTNLLKKFKSVHLNNTKVRKSQFETEFIKQSIKKLEEQKIKQQQRQIIESKLYMNEQKDIISTSNCINYNVNQVYSSNNILINSHSYNNYYSQNHESWQFFNQQHIFHEQSNQNHNLITHQKKVSTATTDQKQKDICIQSSNDVSLQLEFIKSQIYYGQKQDDFISAENLIKSFQPAYHHYLF